MGSAGIESATTEDKEPRKIKQAKRRDVKIDKPIIDEETGEVIEMDGSSDSEDVEYMDDGEVVQASDDEDWEDDNLIEEAKKKKKVKEQKPKYEDDEERDMVDELPAKTTVCNDQKDPLKDDEELDYDSSAYQMLHRANVEWPCLSIDTLITERTTFQNNASAKEWFQSQMNGLLNPADTVFDKRLNMNLHKKDKFPLSVYFCGGSQCANANDNKIYVMKWFDMDKTLEDDKLPSDNSDLDEEELMDKLNSKMKEPIIRYESIPHRGCVNRIRSLHGSSIVATWSDQNEVGIYNVTSAVQALDGQRVRQVCVCVCV